MTDGQAVRLAAREGPALLQGLVVCGLCGRHMEVDYRGVHRYDCTALPKQFGLAMCASLHGPSIDSVVVQAFFAALQPAQLNALDAILADQQAERGRLERHWQERRKRAEYEAHLARRQYDVVDPDNRLVAGELERRWEEKLRQVQQVEEEYERFQRTATPPSLTEEQRTLFREISTT
jgi:Recombinase zinc beta ribbon domain